MKITANPKDKTQLIVEPESLLEYLVVMGQNTDNYPKDKIKMAEKVGQLAIPGIGHLMAINHKWALILDSSVQFIEVNIQVHEK